VPIKSRWDLGPFYMPELDRIQLRSANAFTKQHRPYATWRHEVIHSTGHNSRLKANLFPAPWGFPTATPARSWVAELALVLLGDRWRSAGAWKACPLNMGHWIENCSS